MRLFDLLRAFALVVGFVAVYMGLLLWIGSLSVGHCG